MGNLKWYKRDPAAALQGMMELTLEERGAYNTVLDLIYSRDGDLADDERFIAGWLRVDVRVWRRIRAALIERGKLFAANGCLRNSRADAEVDAALCRIESARDAGRASAASRASKSDKPSKKNNALDRTGVETTASTGAAATYSHIHNKNHSVAEATGDASPPMVSASDFTRRIFGTGVALLAAAGIDDRQARSIIGRWRKGNSDGAVLAVLARAERERPSAPVEWITAALRMERKQALGDHNGHERSGRSGSIVGNAERALARLASTDRH